MSLKSIRESYSKLLTVFNDAGIKLSESQKADLDTFVLAIEENMAKQRETAIRQTKQLVEAKMEKEYKAVFESIMTNSQENAALAAKIQDKVTQISEAKKIADKVDNFLDLYVEKVLPTKTVVDYDRMQKLEKLHESLRSSLLVDDDAVQAKCQQLEESYTVKASKCETEVAKMQVKLNESIKNELKMKKQLDAVKAVELLESKTKDLPTFEARAVKKQLNAASVEEVEKTFDKTLKNVKENMKKLETEQEKTIEEEITDVLEAEDVKEDDLLKNRPHNAHVSVDEDEVEEDDILKNRPHNAHVALGVGEEKFETMEEVQFDEDGDVQLDESEVIDSDLMQTWCNQSVEVR